MEEYQKEFARLLADTGALFFAPGLRLKDGRPTPYFVNMGLFRTGRLASLLGGLMARLMVGRGLAGQVDVILGPSYKGSALAVAAAQALWTEHGLDVMFEYDRKEAKTHGEATGAQSLFVTGALAAGGRVYVVDDVGTSMGTKYELLERLDQEARRRGVSCPVVGVGLAVDRRQTTAVYDENGGVREGVRGRDALAEFTAQTGVPVHSLAPIDQVIACLAEEKRPVMVDGNRRPLAEAELRSFEEYLALYGATGR